VTAPLPGLIPAILLQNLDELPDSHSDGALDGIDRITLELTGAGIAGVRV